MESLTVKAQNLIFVCRWQNLSLFVYICLYLSGFFIDLFLKGSILIKYMLF